MAKVEANVSKNDAEVSNFLAFVANWVWEDKTAYSVLL